MLSETKSYQVPEISPPVEKNRLVVGEGPHLKLNFQHFISISHLHHLHLISTWTSIEPAPFSSIFHTKEIKIWRKKIRIENFRVAFYWPPLAKYTQICLKTRFGYAGVINMCALSFSNHITVYIESFGETMQNQKDNFFLLIVVYTAYIWFPLFSFISKIYQLFIIFISKTKQSHYMFTGLRCDPQLF